MNRYIVTVHRSGRFTLPAAIRRDLDLHPGDSLIWFEQDGEILFRKAEPYEISGPAHTSDESRHSTSDTEDKQKDER